MAGDASDSEEDIVNSSMFQHVSALKEKQMIQRTCTMNIIIKADLVGMVSICFKFHVVSRHSDHPCPQKPGV